MTDTHEFVADWYRPASCVNCGQKRDHSIHIVEEAMTAPDITIPPEALEAAARAVHNIDRKIAGEDQWPAWEDISPTDQRRRLHRARAACLAMLKNWPGMKPCLAFTGDQSREWPDDYVEARMGAALLLPLPKEPKA